MVQNTMNTRKNKFVDINKSSFYQVFIFILFKGVLVFLKQDNDNIL